MSKKLKLTEVEKIANKLYQIDSSDLAPCYIIKNNNRIVKKSKFNYYTIENYLKEAELIIRTNKLKRLKKNIIRKRWTSKLTKIF